MRIEAEALVGQASEGERTLGVTPGVWPGALEHGPSWRLLDQPGSRASDGALLALHD